jgi:hypothetical protein
MTTKYQPRYRLYAKSQGRTPFQQLAFDDKKWPGGRSIGFILWMREKWNEWFEQSGLPRGEFEYRTLYTKEFDAWLRRTLNRSFASKRS